MEKFFPGVRNANNIAVKNEIAAIITCSRTVNSVFLSLILVMMLMTIFFVFKCEAIFASYETCIITRFCRKKYSRGIYRDPFLEGRSSSEILRRISCDFAFHLKACQERLATKIEAPLRRNVSRASAVLSKHGKAIPDPICAPTQETA